MRRRKRGPLRDAKKSPNYNQARRRRRRRDLRSPCLETLEQRVLLSTTGFGDGGSDGFEGPIGGLPDAEFQPGPLIGLDGTTFRRLGDLAGGDSFSEAQAISADGLTVVGVSESASGREAFRWMAGEGMVVPAFAG